MAEPVGKLTYVCPYCGQKLSFMDGTVVKMVGRLHADTFSCKTMFYIPARLGQYGGIVGEGLRVKEGAFVEFECINGQCKRNFTTAYDQNLAEIKMIDEADNEFVVIFNKIYGKKATFLVDLKQKRLVNQFGEDADSYYRDFNDHLNFFGC